MAETILDSLVIKLSADNSDLTRGLDLSLAKVGEFDNLLARSSGTTIGAFEDMTTAGFDLGRHTVDVAGNMGEAFERFALRGKFSFDSLKDTALSSLNQIAAEIIRSGISSIFGGGGSSGGGVGSVILGTVSSLFGARADGGPVSEGVPYLVGERGPELFLPGVSGAVVPNHQMGQFGGGSRSTNITINLGGVQNAEGVRQSAGQVAVAVRQALARAERNL